MPEEDDHLAATYSLIYSFLTEQAHTKAAKAVKKAAKGITAVESSGQDGPSLPVIIEQWKKFTEGKQAVSPIESTRSESSSSDADSDPSETLESTTLNTRTKSVRATDETRQGATNALNIPANRRVTKRRRLDEEGGSIPTAIIQQPKAADLRQEMNGKGQSRKTNMPFSRIKVDEIKFVDERLKDNTFESRKAGYNDYGARASADLAVTRGAGFRKEKNKKKRGSYRGGEITMESHSIKFTD